jgi:RsiW-degrading membrane proteinase PrsW (M82 family)
MSQTGMSLVHRLSWLWILIVGIALFELVRRTIITTGNPNLLPLLILLGAATIPAAFVAFLFQRRLPYDIDAGTIAALAFLGGVVGVVTASTLEFRTLQRLGTLPMVAVALVEESAKLLVPLVIVLFTRYRRPEDGLIVGVAVGAGFAVLETMGYGFVVLIQSNGDLSAVDGVLLLRGLLSPAAHMAWTGLTAAALWDAADKHWHTGRLFRFVGIFAIAVALHTAWDSATSTPVYALVAAVSLVLLAATAHRLHHLVLTGVRPGRPERPVHRLSTGLGAY